MDTSAVPLALEPTVMAPYATRVGETPRRVQIERKKRAFAALSVDDVLRSMPDIDALVSVPHPLPLESFDDTEHETRATSQWQGLVTTRLESYSPCNQSSHPNLSPRARGCLCIA